MAVKSLEIHFFCNDSTHLQSLFYSLGFSILTQLLRHDCSLAFIRMLATNNPMCRGRKPPIFVSNQIKAEKCSCQEQKRYKIKMIPQHLHELSRVSNFEKINHFCPDRFHENANINFDVMDCIK